MYLCILKNWEFYSSAKEVIGDGFWTSENRNLTVDTIQSKFKSMIVTIVAIIRSAHNPHLYIIFLRKIIDNHHVRVICRYTLFSMFIWKWESIIYQNIAEKWFVILTYTFGIFFEGIFGDNPQGL